MMRKTAVCFAPGVVDDPVRRGAVTGCRMFERWWSDASREFTLVEVLIETVDFFRHLPDRPLFIKMRVKALDRAGRTIVNAIVLRGDAVAILVVLKNDARGDQLLLVKQARLAVGAEQLLEIPAGVIDGDEDPLETAVREVQEETGLAVAREELINLLPTHPEGVLNSVGILDERLFLYAWERETTTAELDALQGELHGVEGEGERIRLELRSADSFAELVDGKSLMAWLLWRNRSVLQKRT